MKRIFISLFFLLSSVSAFTQTLSIEDLQKIRDADRSDKEDILMQKGFSYSFDDDDETDFGSARVFVPKSEQSKGKSASFFIKVHKKGGILVISTTKENLYLLWKEQAKKLGYIHNTSSKNSSIHNFGNDKYLAKFMMHVGESTGMTFYTIAFGTKLDFIIFATKED